MNLIALLLACEPTALTVGAPSGTTDDTALTDDTGEVVEPHADAGDYELELGYYVPNWDWEICSTKGFELSVDDEGVLSASGDCLYESQQGDYPLEISMSGTVDEDGEVEGTVTYSMWIITNDWEIDDLESDLGGTFDDGEVELWWEGEADMNGYYDDQTVIGWAQGELQ